MPQRRHLLDWFSSWRRPAFHKEKNNTGKVKRDAEGKPLFRFPRAPEGLAYLPEQPGRLELDPYKFELKNVAQRPPTTFSANNTNNTRRRKINTNRSNINNQNFLKRVRRIISTGTPINEYRRILLAQSVEEIQDIGIGVSLGIPDIPGSTDPTSVQHNLNGPIAQQALEEYQINVLNEILAVIIVLIGDEIRLTIKLGGDIYAIRNAYNQLQTPEERQRSEEYRNTEDQRKAIRHAHQRLKDAKRRILAAKKSSGEPLTHEEIAENEALSRSELAGPGGSGISLGPDDFICLQAMCCCICGICQILTLRGGARKQKRLRKQKGGLLAELAVGAFFLSILLCISCVRSDIQRWANINKQISKCDLLILLHTTLFEGGLMQKFADRVNFYSLTEEHKQLVLTAGNAGRFTGITREDFLDYITEFLTKGIYKEDDVVIVEPPADRPGAPIVIGEVPAPPSAAGVGNLGSVLPLPPPSLPGSVEEAAPPLLRLRNAGLPARLAALPPLPPSPRNSPTIHGGSRTRRRKRKG